VALGLGWCLLLVAAHLYMNKMVDRKDLVADKACKGMKCCKYCNRPHFNEGLWVKVDRAPTI
jgi:hypothetical protein